MAKKSIGYVKLIWTCPRCATRNPGPNKFCNGCGAPQPEDVQFEQPAEAELIKDSAELARAKAGPDIHCPYCGARNPAGVKFCGACGGDLTQGKARQTGRVVGAYRAPSGATRPCPACGTPNPLTSLKCSNCGSALPAAETPSPAATARAPSAKTPLLIGGVAALCLVAVAVLGFLFFQRDEQSGIVESVAWERTIEIERYGPVEHQDWEDEVPAAASALSCEIEYRMTQDDPAPVATEVCGTPYTVDEGSGFGEVVQDCTYRGLRALVHVHGRRVGRQRHPARLRRRSEPAMAGGQPRRQRRTSWRRTRVLHGHAPERRRRPLVCAVDRG